MARRARGLLRARAVASVMLDTARRAELRSRLRAEAAAAEKLWEQVINTDLKGRLALLSTKLADIETFYLDQQDERSKSAEKWWLDSAEQEIQLHIGTLRLFNKAVVTFGYDVDKF